MTTSKLDRFPSTVDAFPSTLNPIKTPKSNLEQKEKEKIDEIFVETASLVEIPSVQEVKTILLKN